MSQPTIIPPFLPLEKDTLLWNLAIPKTRPPLSFLRRHRHTFRILSWSTKRKKRYLGSSHRLCLAAGSQGDGMCEVIICSFFRQGPSMTAMTTDFLSFFRSWIANTQLNHMDFVGGHGEDTNNRIGPKKVSRTVIFADKWKFHQTRVRGGLS